MLPRINPTQTRCWQKLNEHFAEIKNVHMRDLFAEDPTRFDRFHVRFKDILLDYSKNRITEKTMALLIELARETGVQEAVAGMFNGDKINETENRPVLHIALRNRTNSPIMVDGEDVMPRVNDVLQKMAEFSKKVVSGKWRGYSGKKITDIVNIGIGGSDLGPVMVTEALRPYAVPGMRVHFVSNIDGTHIAERQQGTGVADVMVGLGEEVEIEIAGHLAAQGVGDDRHGEEVPAGVRGLGEKPVMKGHGCASDSAAQQ